MSLYHALFLTEYRCFLTFGSQSHSLLLCKQTYQFLCSLCEIHENSYSLPFTSHVFSLLVQSFSVQRSQCQVQLAGSWLLAPCPWRAPAEGSCSCQSICLPCGNHRNNTRIDISNRLQKVCCHSCIIAYENENNFS